MTSTGEIIRSNQTGRSRLRNGPLPFWIPASDFTGGHGGRRNVHGRNNGVPARSYSTLDHGDSRACRHLRRRRQDQHRHPGSAVAPIIVDPEHWRDRAARMQALAVKMAGSLAAVLLNNLVVHYEKLAEQAALKSKSPLNGP
jgi:hypothetical protein